MKILKRKQKDEAPVRNARDQSGRSAPVFSYYSNRSAEQGRATRSDPSNVAVLHNTPMWVRYLPSLLSLAIVGVAALYMTTLSTHPRVTIVSSPEQPVVVQSNEVYQTAASDLFKESLLNKSKLTINTNTLAHKLENEFPELGDVVVTIPLFGRRPSVQTQPADPKLILSGNGGSYVIDSDGVPILRAQQLASSIRDTLPVIRDDSDTPIELGTQVLTSDLVAFVNALHRQFDAKSISVEEYSFPALANELHVRLVGKGYYLKFNTETDARVQTGAYLALEEILNRDGITPSEYIDLRVEERAYYR